MFQTFWHPDIWANGIAIYLGKGAGELDGGTPYDTATHGGPSLIADHDHDGTPDVISLSFGSGNPVRMHLFRGLGDGAQGSKTTFETHLANGDWPSTRTINGMLEILVSERSGHLGILRYANGAVSVSTIAAGPGMDLSSTFADLNGDGIADIVEEKLRVSAPPRDNVGGHGPDQRIHPAISVIVALESSNGRCRTFDPSASFVSLRKMSVNLRSYLNSGRLMYVPYR